MGNFTATHHALLFAWISRAVINAVGEEKGEGIIRKAVVKYGMQRGKRMAMRAKANGAEFCDFTFKDANLTAYNMIGLVFKKMIKPGKKAIMPWEYYAGHLYKTIGEVITDELGEQAEKIMTASLKDFTDKYGKPAGEIVKSYENTDFDKLP